MGLLPIISLPAEAISWNNSEFSAATETSGVFIYETNTHLPRIVDKYTYNGVTNDNTFKLYQAGSSGYPTSRYMAVVTPGGTTSVSILNSFKDVWEVLPLPSTYYYSDAGVLSVYQDMYVGPMSYTDTDGRTVTISQEVNRYLGFGLYASWTKWHDENWDSISQRTLDIAKGTYLPDAPTVQYKTYKAYKDVHFGIEGNPKTEWEAADSDETLTIQEVLTTTGRVDGLTAQNIVDYAFGAGSYELLHDPKAELYTLPASEFDVRRSQLLYLYLLFKDAGMGDADFRLGTRIMTAEQQREEKENMVQETLEKVNTATGDILDAIWVLQYYGNAITGLDDETVYVKEETKDWYQLYKDKQTAAFGSVRHTLFYTVPERINFSKSWLDATILAYMYFGHENAYDLLPVATETEVNSDAKRREPQIRSALEYLQSYQANYGNIAQESNTQRKLTLFVYRFYVAYGVMSGVLDEKCLDVLGGDRTYNLYNASFLYAPAPTFCIASRDQYVSYKGMWALLNIYNEYRSIIYTLVNNTAKYIDSEGATNNLNDILQNKDCVILIHNMLQDFNDKNMWDVWYDSNMDMTKEENGYLKKSLADVYAFLAAQHAFDGDIGFGADGKNGTWGYFFNSDTLSDSILIGVKESAKFLPMRTNVYDPATWASVDTAWLLNYYAKFGYFRKALYIDTAEDAAVSFGNTGGRGQLQVATLEDMLQDKDIVLYIDDNLYNVNTLSELVGKAWDRLGQDAVSNEGGKLGQLKNAITGLWEIGMPELAKTAERTTYSSRVSEADTKSGKWDNFFLSEQPDTSTVKEREPASTAAPAESAQPTESAPPVQSQEIKEDETTGTIYKKSDSADSILFYLWPDYVWDDVMDSQVQDENGMTARTTEYTPLFGFAVLSAVYRDNGLKNTLNSMLTSNNPVFISSGSAPFAVDSLQNTIYNYMLVRNLEAQIPVDYSVNLDMSSPLYMDIFGNILTESGYVVIPAAANATLWGTSYQPYNAAFFACYGDSFYLPYKETTMSGGVHRLLTTGDTPLCSVRDGVYRLNSLRTTDGTVNAAMLSTANQQALDDVADTWAAYIKGGVRGASAPYTLSKWKMILTEVLRGAPIENIDKQFEGIQTNVTYTRSGLIAADKLEILCNAIAPAGQNASIAIPNPAFMDGIEIIVFFVYKVLILAVLLIWMITVYLDATGGVIGIKTGLKCIGVVCLVLALIVGVPKIFELSYYESNKFLLQDETEYLLMLNTEKKANGQEIGVTRVRPPETSTTLYLYLADIDMPWWDLLSGIGLSAGYKSLDEMYKDYSGRHPLAYSEFATTMNDGIYISVDQLFESAGVQFSPLSHRLYVTGSNNTPASYYTPYYWFLYSITERVTEWSKLNNAIAYTTKIQKGGELKTIGYSQLYFDSADFLENDNDFFHLYQVYDVWTDWVDSTKVNPDTLNTLRESQWCLYGADGLTEKAFTDRIVRLQQYAKEWIANNHSMIGRVSDETFLKCFALSCAMEHNRLFNTQRADYLEIQQLSNEDLLRLSIADHNTVMSYSSMSYARFVYTTGGTVAVYLAAMLELVNLIGSWVKPACTLLVFCIACISIFVLKLILRRGNNSIMGYILTITLMCSVNLLGAGVTKLSMFLPNTGLTPALCILLQIIVQVFYIWAQMKIVEFALRDWQNVGYQRYEHQFNKMRAPFHRNEMLSRNVLTPTGTTGYAYFDGLKNNFIGRSLRK